jgi:hypothetical protein
MSIRSCHRLLKTGAYVCFFLPILLQSQVIIRERVEIRPQLDTPRVPITKPLLMTINSSVLRLDLSFSGSLQPDYPSNFYISRNACQPGGLIFLRDPGRSISVPALASAYSYGATIWAFAGASATFMLYLDGELLARHDYPNLPAKARYFFPHYQELFESFTFVTGDTLIAEGEQATFNINGVTNAVCASSVWHPELQMTLTIVSGQELGGFIDENGDTLGTSVIRKGSEMKQIRFYAKPPKPAAGGGTTGTGNLVVIEATSKGITRTVQIRIKPGFKIKLVVADKTVQPLGDSDNKDNPDLTEKETRPKVIDFSRVKTTTVTVRVVDSEEKPVSDYDFTMRALIRDASGGHDHSEGRPTGRFVTEENDTLAEVEGKTGADGEAKYTYLCSGIGGIDSIYVQGRTPYDTATATILLKMGEFELLQDGTTYKLVGQTGIHPLNHYGTSKTLSTLRQLADSAFAYSKWILQYNDISLMCGGPFDVGKTKRWDTPHETHREGRNVDMRPTSVSGDEVTLKWLRNLVRTNDWGRVLEEAEGEPWHHHHLTIK